MYERSIKPLRETGCGQTSGPPPPTYVLKSQFFKLGSELYRTYHLNALAIRQML